MTNNQDKQFDPKDLLVSYFDYIEFESEEKLDNFEKKVFQKNYGYGNLNYIFRKKVIETDGNSRYFAVVEEVFVGDELKQLAKNCQCDYHLCWIKIPFLTAPCPCCVGCLASDNGHPDRSYVVKRTRDYLKKRNDLWSFSSLSSFHD